MKKSLAIAIIAQAVSIIILLFLFTYFFKQLNTLSDYTYQVERTYLVMSQLTQVRSELKDAETSSRGFIITDRADFTKLLHRSKTEFFAAMDSLRELLKNNDAQMVYLKKAERLGYEILLMQLENARLHQRMSTDSLMARMEFGRLQMEEMEYFLSKMYDNEAVVLAELNEMKRMYEDRLPVYSKSVFFIAGFLTLVFGLWIFIELKKRFKYQALLQQKFMELRQNNEELEQIAFAASHDLQEPLRKIRVFSDRLLLKAMQSDDSNALQMCERMNAAAAKMQDLITDLVTFNQLVQNNYTPEPVDLEKLIRRLIAQNSFFEGTNNAVSIEFLPTVMAAENQLEILFQHLIANAIQFRCADKDFKLQFTSNRVTWNEITGLPREINSGSFHHIKVIDNGIGFDEAFKGKMFKPFQRLHNSDGDSNVSRKGMGLAICKRVMLNAGGWIDAEGKVEKGATIHLYFPVT